MNKYDTQIELDKKTSLTYMISHIESGASVLEFGPATGYMTRYLCEEKDCNVYIIEIDEEAYKMASVYAQDGICCDAEQMAWVEKFKGMKFDYITFADVLEHLKEPAAILKQCLEFLEDSGKILASVPNIGHNAVLIDLFNNKFQYRKTGIMDNTHLRFYTHDSLHELFEQCGLGIADEDAIVFDLEYAGFDNTEKDVPEDFWKEIYGRKYGFVNQFLFTLVKTSERVEKEKHCFRDIKTLETSLYYMTEQDEGKYSEEHKIVSKIYWEDGSFYAEFDMAGIQEGIVKLCFQPFMSHCVIESIKMIMNADEVPMSPLGGFPMENGGWGFINDYPKYEVDVTKEEGINQIRLEGRVRNIEQKELGQCIRKAQEETSQKIASLNEIIGEKMSIIHEMGADIVANNQELERLNKVIEDKLDIIHEMGATITANNQEMGRLNKVIEDKLDIIHEMSAAITANNQEIERLNKVIEQSIDYKMSNIIKRKNKI